MAGLGSPQGHWVISSEERKKHETTFQSLKPMSGFLSGEQAKQFFLKSNLPPLVLGKIWSLSDLDHDGKMTMQEFTVAMHLIQNKLKGIDIPTVLPNTLKMTSLPSTGKMGNPSYGPQGVSNGFTNMSGSMTLPKSSGISWSGINQPTSMAASSGISWSGISQSNTSSAPSSGISWSGMNQPNISSGISYGIASTSMNALGSLSSSFSLRGGGGFNTNTTNIGFSNGPGIMTSSIQPQLSLTQGNTLQGTMNTNSNTLTPATRLKYNQMFKSLDFKNTGVLSGEQARGVLIQSGLSQTLLAKIWSLSDLDKDSQLNIEEFALAMYFVDVAKQGKQLPNQVPQELLPLGYQGRAPSDSIGSEGRDRSGSNVSLDGRSRSGSLAEDKRTIFTFEDKRKQNFEKGRLELERRRQDLQEKLKRERDEREAKERQEEERRQRAKLEAEQRRQAELEKQRQQQLEMEKEQEALRKKMIQQRLAAQIEAERQRQLEWQKRKEEELLNQKGLEQDIVNNLKTRKKNLNDDLATVVGKKTAAQQCFDKEQQSCSEAQTTFNNVNQKKEMCRMDINRIQCEIKEYQQRLLALSNEKERLTHELNKRETSKMAEAHGNAMASLQDSKAAIKRKQTMQSNLEKDLNDKLKELDSLNAQLKEAQNNVQQLTEENARLQQTVESKQREYTSWKQKKDEEERMKKELEAKRKREEEENRKQKEREQEAMRKEQEQQRKDQEIRRRMQEAREAEARRKDQQLLTKDKIVVQQQETLVKTQPTSIWREPAKNQQQEMLVKNQPTSVWGEPAKNQQQENVISQTWMKTTTTTTSENKEVTTKKEAAAVPRPRPRAVKKNVHYYRGLFSFDPRNPDEMKIDEGDIVSVEPDTMKAPPGWLRGKCDDRFGLFPENYVEKITEDEAKKSGHVESSTSPEGKAPEVSVKSLVAAISQQLGGSGGGGGGGGSADIHVHAARQTTSTSTITSTTTNTTTDGPRAEGGTPAPKGLTAVALYAYRGKKDDMLSFAKGDIITITEQQDMWWSGELNGKVGWFPKSYVKVTSSNAATKNTGPAAGSQMKSIEISPVSEPVLESTPEQNLPILFECVALYPYNGEEGDLSFVQGDVIIITKSEGDWWEGKLHDKHGLFPANYVKKVENEGPVAAQRTKPEIATVITAYTATSPDQLSLAPGQLIRVTKKDPSGWWDGELQARGKKRQSGIFPSTHVKILSKSTSPTPTPTATTPSDEDNIYEVPTSIKAAVPAAKLDQVLAMFPYAAQNTDELTFYKGSVINVISREGDWWKGEMNGKVGMFPSNYVQALSDLPESTTQWTVSFDEKVLASMSDVEQQRQNAIYELMNTEQTYVDHLSLTLEVFYNPLAESNLLTKEELLTVFVNWKELIHCNMKLLKAFLVRRKMRNNGLIMMIGDLMCEQLPHFSPYVRFCSRQLKACQLIQQKIETNPEFKQLEKKCCSEPRANGLPLSSYLLKPLQRMCKYPLLIKEVLKYTPEDHPDRYNLQTALEKAEELCNQVNEGVRSQESSDRLEWLQSHVNLESLGEQLIFNSATNCLGPRRLIYSGTLYKVKSGKELKAFLFNDFLLFTRPQSSLTGNLSKKIGFDSSESDTQYTIYRKPIFLNEVVVKRPADLNSDDYSFQISHIDRVYILKSDSKLERNKWIENLEKAAEHYVMTERLTRQKAHRARSLRTPGIGTLNVTILEGKDLVASDPSGLSDPYCEVSMGSQEHRTKVCPQTLNPKWNSNMSFIIKDMEQDVLCITVFDRDLFSPNDFLGRTEVSLSSLRKKTNSNGPWVERLLLHEVVTGEVLVKLELQ